MLAQEAEPFRPTSNLIDRRIEMPHFPDLLHTGGPHHLLFLPFCSLKPEFHLRADFIDSCQNVRRTKSLQLYSRLFGDSTAETIRCTRWETGGGALKYLLVYCDTGLQTWTVKKGGWRLKLLPGEPLALVCYAVKCTSVIMT